MRNSFFQALAFAMTIIIVSCGQSNDNSSNQTNTQSPNNTEVKTVPEIPQEPVRPKEYYIGDTLDEGTWKFCVTMIEEGKIYNEVFRPKPGEKYVTLDCFFQNTSNEKLEYSLGFWKLADDEGYEYDLEMLGDRRPSFDTGDLEPGKKKKGFVTFACPKSAKNFELHFDPIFNMGTGPTYTIKLQKK
jgi:hypothetical protein